MSLLVVWVQAAVGSEDSTAVVEFPIDAGEGVRTLDEVGLWEQLGLAAFLQRHWADNQVSEEARGQDQGIVYLLTADLVYQRLLTF